MPKNTKWGHMIKTKTKGRMQKGRLTNPQISLVLGLVSPGTKVGMLKAVLSVDLLILVLKSGPRPCYIKCEEKLGIPLPTALSGNTHLCIHTVGLLLVLFWSDTHGYWLTSALKLCLHSDYVDLKHAIKNRERFSVACFDVFTWTCIHFW